MRNKTNLKLLLSLLLLTTPASAQKPDKDAQKSENRTRNFAEFVLYWSEWNAYVDVSGADRRRAERKTNEDLEIKIPELVRDSTYYADQITKSASIINKRYSLDERPDMAFFLYEIRTTYKDRWADKNSEEYKLSKTLIEYEQVLKELKLARYTMKLNKQK